MRASEIWALAYLRFRLLIRQKLGWISIGVGCFLVILALLVAQVSFVNPEKIFWDFALAVSFILQLVLALYLGTQLFSDEKNRRTLHLVLSAGVSRAGWIIGNGLGIFAALFLMNGLWFLLTAVAAKLNFQNASFMMALQAQILLCVEVLVVVFFSIFISLLVRPLLALVGGALTVVFLHSLGDLQRIFTDPQVGRFIEARGSNLALWGAKLLPPLEWFDLKVFVGYLPAVQWSLVAELSLLGALWAGLLACAGWLRFEKMDL